MFPFGFFPPGQGDRFSSRFSWGGGGETVRGLSTGRALRGQSNQKSEKKSNLTGTDYRGPPGTNFEDIGFFGGGTQGIRGPGEISFAFSKGAGAGGKG